MTIETPLVARRLFSRLCRGTNRLLSENGPDDDKDLYRQVHEPDVEAACQIFFAVIGFRLQKGDGCYYFTSDDEPQANIESKLEKMIRLVGLLNFLSTHIEHFSEGVIFSAATLATKCHGDAKAERFLQEAAKGTNFADRITNLLHSLVSQGYLSEYDPARQEYRVLSAIHYLFEFADRIQIYDTAETGGSIAEA
ncbi:MAG: hypothetical protein ABIT76_02480 [Chthoniobacterales bacterium]